MSRSRFTIVGLTGATGAGKSSITHIFAANGCHVIDADAIAREAVQKGSLCLKQLCYAFGDDILLDDGALNRAELAKRAFSSKDGTELLNGITHPAIVMLTMIKIKELVKRGEKIIIFDAPTLFESNTDVMCDFIVAVTAPQDVRLKRIIMRDGITEQQARIRMNAQHDESFYTEQSDFVIENNSTLESVKSEVEQIISFIKRRITDSQN